MQTVDGGLHRTALQFLEVGLNAAPVVEHSLLATGDVEQLGVLLGGPVPVQPHFGKSVVEGRQVHGFGVGQCAVDIKNQRFQHGASRFQNPCLTGGWTDYK